MQPWGTIKHIWINLVWINKVWLYGYVQSFMLSCHVCSLVVQVKFSKLGLYVEGIWSAWILFCKLSFFFVHRFSAKGSLTLEHFEFISVLGRGHFGKVSNVIPSCYLCEVVLQYYFVTYTYKPNLAAVGVISLQVLCSLFMYSTWLFQFCSPEQYWRWVNNCYILVKCYQRIW